MQKLETQTDYWLAQYQRLLDSKPQSLIDQVPFTHSQISYDTLCLICAQKLTGRRITD